MSIVAMLPERDTYEKYEMDKSSLSLTQASSDKRAGRELEGRTWDEMPTKMRFAKAS